MTGTPGRNPDLALRADVRDALAIHDHHLLREHLTAVAVEEAASADGDRARRRGTLQDAALGPHTRLRAGNATGGCAGAGWSRWRLRQRPSTPRDKGFRKRLRYESYVLEGG